MLAVLWAKLKLYSINNYLQFRAVDLRVGRWTQADISNSPFRILSYLCSSNQKSFNGSHLSLMFVKHPEGGSNLIGAGWVNEVCE